MTDGAYSGVWTWCIVCRKYVPETYWTLDGQRITGCPGCGLWFYAVREEED